MMTEAEKHERMHQVMEACINELAKKIAGLEKNRKEEKMAIEPVARQEIISVIDLPYSLELTRYQKGNYGWVIKVHARDGEKLFQEVQAIDLKCQSDYVNDAAVAVKKEGE